MNKKIATVLILFLLLLLAVCWGRDDAGPRLDAQIVECPHDWRWGEREAVVETFTTGRDNVPEYNDCQRFLVGSEAGPIYDSLYAIFASGSLDTLHQDPVAGTAESQRFGRASALIRAWGEYPALGIRPGFNCLVLTPGAAWNAHIVPAKGDADCNGELVLGTSTPLVVVREPVDRARFDASSVPPVARWGFDRRIWAQYIVIKCGDATCYVGPPEFSPRTLPDQLAELGMAPSDGATTEIAGWHDSQFLAERPTTGPIRPTNPPLFGAVIPDERLGERTHAEFRAGWVPVAEVAMSAHSDQYTTKANFGATTDARQNVILSCIDEGNCTGLPDKTVDCMEADALSGERWRTMHINAATSDTTYHCVEYRALGSADSGLDIPGTARWRWLEEDETVWFRCPNGCCKIAY